MAFLRGYWLKTDKRCRPQVRCETKTLKVDKAAESDAVSGKGSLLVDTDRRKQNNLP